MSKSIGWVLVFAAACNTPTVRVEGMTSGDCSDGADNDVDGLFDCADPSCAGAPICSVLAPDAGVEGDAGMEGDAGIEGDGGIDGDGGPLPDGFTFPERDFVCTPGEAQPCATTSPAHGAAARTFETSDVVRNETLTFVVNTMSIPEASGGYAAGFNLDGLDSGEGSTEATSDCEEFAPDYLSLLDPEHVGVDNVYQGLVGTVEGFLPSESCPGGVRDGCLDALLQQQIDAGSTLLVEVRGVDDLEYDSEVTVQLYEAAPVGALALADGLLAPGQRFAGTAVGVPMTGDIFEGRVRVRPVTFALPSTGDALLGSTMIVHDAELRFDVARTGLSTGQIGGTLSVEELIAATDAGNRDAVRSVLENIADVEPSADPLICTHVSIGMTFAATTAIRME